MTAVPNLPSAEPYLRQWTERRAGLPGGGLAWLAHQRETGIERFRAKGVPTPRTEAWKYTNLRALERIAFQPPAANEAVLAFLESRGFTTGIDRGAVVVTGQWLRDQLARR